MLLLPGCFLLHLEQEKVCCRSRRGLVLLKHLWALPWSDVPEDFVRLMRKTKAVLTVVETISEMWVPGLPVGLFPSLHTENIMHQTPNQGSFLKC